jgi:uncharacterized repeat protein (TIGR03847 family)
MTGGGGSNCRRASRLLDKGLCLGAADPPIDPGSNAMANPVYEFDPVTHITAGALGLPGNRVFYIQAERGLDRVTLLCEKEHVQELAKAIDEMLDKLEEEFKLARAPIPTVDEVKMTIKEPVEPLFRVGAMALGYDANRDRMLFVAQETLSEDEDRDPQEVRFFATRAQMQTLSAYAKDVVGRGRSPEQRAHQIEAHVRRNGHGE